MTRTGTGPADAHSPKVRLERRATFVRHADRLRELLAAEDAWPSGKAAAKAALLIAQHADTQLDVQRRFLEQQNSPRALGTRGCWRS